MVNKISSVDPISDTWITRGKKGYQIGWPEVLTISHSRAKKWRRCKMAHNYRYVQKLRPIRKRTPLLKGSVLDKAIGAWMERRPWEPIIEEFRREFNRLFVEERAELGDLPKELEKIVEGYAAFYRNDGLTYVRRRRRITQIPVRIYLDNRTLFLGYIDAYPRDRQGRNWLLDTKSTKRVPGEEGRFADIQFVFYAWALRELGYPVPDGVIWDYVQSVIPKKTGRATYRRIRLPHPKKEMIATVLKDLRDTAEEIREHGKTATTRSLDWSCPMCEYYSLCQAEVRGLDSEFIRKKEFTVKGEEKRKIETEEEEAE